MGTGSLCGGFEREPPHRPYEQRRKPPAELVRCCDYDYRGEGGQRLNQDAWDQVRLLIKNIL